MAQNSAYEKLSKLFENVFQSVDEEWLAQEIKRLTETELPQTFTAYKNSANQVYQLLENFGFAPEMLTFPADGKTVYGDFVSPLAWEATMGRLTVVSSPKPLENNVVADYEKMPFSLIKHSVSTPKGGIRAKLVSEAQVYAGADCRGAFVLLEENTQPMRGAIVPLLDLGAIGFVSEFMVGGLRYPDDVQWANAATEGPQWHCLAGDREFISYSVSSRVGRQLREAVNAGSVTVLAESDGRRYVGEVSAVTATLPGKSKKEVWLLGHLYEPLIDDNSSGAMEALYSLALVKKLVEQGVLPQPNLTLRIVMAMESYGFEAVAAHMGGYIGDRAVGALNLDGLPILNYGKPDDMIIKYGPLCCPFYGNFIFKMLCQVYMDKCGSQMGQTIADGYTGFDDDALLGDSTHGLPTIWPQYHCERRTDTRTGLWHNSAQNYSLLNHEKLKASQCFSTAWAAAMTCMNESDLPVYLEEAVKLAQQVLNEEAQKPTYIGSAKARMQFFYNAMKEAILSFKQACNSELVDKAAQSLVLPEVADTAVNFKWLDYAKTMLPKRLTVGLPHNLAKLNNRDKKKVPDGMLYGTMAFIMSAMDGKKTLDQAICEAMWETQFQPDEKALKTYIDAVIYHAEAGYVDIEYKDDLHRETIAKALEELGVNKGDVLLVHSSLSELGHIDGGANTAIDALLDAVGEQGTLLMPAFTRPYIIFEGSVNTQKNFRPYDKDDLYLISTGKLPRTLLTRKGAVRSENATHSWAALGAKAQQCVKDHALLDPPASQNSPMARALELGGKVLFFGCDLTSNTFLHFLEHMSGASYLKNAVIKVKNPDGSLSTEVVHQHLPGDREFYHSPAIKCKFYTRAVQRGLQIKQVQLGVGMLSLIDLKQLYEIGMQLLKEDPNVLLCDDPNCAFCKNSKR